MTLQRARGLSQLYPKLFDGTIPIACLPVQLMQRDAPLSTPVKSVANQLQRRAPSRSHSASNCSSSSGTMARRPSRGSIHEPAHVPRQIGSWPGGYDARTVGTAEPQFGLPIWSICFDAELARPSAAGAWTPHGIDTPKHPLWCLSMIVHKHSTASGVRTNLGDRQPTQSRFPWAQICNADSSNVRARQSTLLQQFRVCSEPPLA